MTYGKDEYVSLARVMQDALGNPTAVMNGGTIIYDLSDDRARAWEAALSQNAPMICNHAPNPACRGMTVAGLMREAMEDDHLIGCNHD